MRKKPKRKSRSKAPIQPTPLGVYQAFLFGVGFYCVSLLSGDAVTGVPANGQSPSLPFRPIGSVSAVDRYRRPSTNPIDPNTDRNTHQNASFRTTGNPFNETGFRDRGDAYGTTRSYGNVRQVAMQSDGFALPPQGSFGGEPTDGNGGGMAMPNQFTPPPLNTPPASQPPPRMQGSPQPPISSVPPPRSLPNYPAPPIADYQPIAPPQLVNGGFATMADCRLITPASSYTAMSPYGNYGGDCRVIPTSYADPRTMPAQIAAPAMMPPTLPPTTLVPITPPGAYPPNAAGSAAPVGSLVTFGQQNYPVQVGQGLWGQPVAYVPGQSFRNWLRYLSF